MIANRTSLGLAAALAMVCGGAQAAPQILGIVASNGPVPLNCDVQGCRADLSSFCLQQPRANPSPGQAYFPVEGAEIALIGTTASGETTRLPAAPYMSFATDRGFTAIEVTIPAETVAALGLSGLAVEIGEKVSLLPAAAGGDKDPQTADEIALATGAFRDKGVEFFDRGSDSGDAIRLANRLINALPKRGRLPGETDGRLLESAIATPAGRAAEAEGIAMAREMFGTCRQKVDVTHHVATMRACLEGTHDRLVANTNVAFWESLGNY
jgi:hypothetical protein